MSSEKFIPVGSIKDCKKHYQEMYDVRLGQRECPFCERDGLISSLAKAKDDYDRLRGMVSRYEELEILYADGLLAVEELINNSAGVVGLHLNGEIATWDTLREGGYFEAWLHDFDAALATLAALKEDKP